LEKGKGKNVVSPPFFVTGEIIVGERGGTTPLLRGKGRKDI